MGEPGPSSKPDELPEWFLRYVQGQRNQAAATQENERSRVADQENKAREARLQLVRNDTKPGKSLPLLLEYYGEADKLEAWLQQARAKMEVDYHGCTEYVKFWALNGSLRGKALRRMEAWVREQGTPELANSYALLSRLEFVFTDPQAKERAQRKMESLRQGTKPFLDVFTEWQSLLLESGGGSWPDDAKKLSLDRILSDELVRAMITVPSQPSFECYCSILKETDDRLKAYKARTSKLKDPATSGTFNPTWKRSKDERRTFTENKPIAEPKLTRKASVESMEWEPTPAKVSMAGARRAKWASKEEREDRRCTGRCIRCGASGHMIRECPYRRPQRPVTMDAARKGKEIAKEVAPELDDDELSSESENL
jgi:hypothetical protein